MSHDTVTVQPGGHVYDADSACRCNRRVPPTIAATRRPVAFQVRRVVIRYINGPFNASGREWQVGRRARIPFCMRFLDPGIKKAPSETMGPEFSGSGTLSQLHEADFIASILPICRRRALLALILARASAFLSLLRWAGVNDEVLFFFGTSLGSLLFCCLLCCLAFCFTSLCSLFCHD